MKILITGQTGVGKSELLKSFDHFSFDEHNRSVWMKKGSEYYDFIENTFGPTAVNGSTIDNSKLGKILFSNHDALEKLNDFVEPIVREWINSLPENSIIEFAQYITNEDKYKGLFDKVILIKNDSPNLEDKFKYLNKKHQPIKKVKIKYDYEIDNTNFKGKNEFNTLIKKLMKK